MRNNYLSSKALSFVYKFLIALHVLIQLVSLPEDPSDRTNSLKTKLARLYVLPIHGDTRP